MSINLEHGGASAVSCTDSATIEGAHAKYLLYVFDEAKSIPTETFDSSEGAFSNSGADSTKFLGKLVVISTPGGPQGRFMTS